MVQSARISVGAPVLNGSAPCTYLRQVERSGGVAGVRPATGLVGVHGVWLARGVLWPEAVDAEVRGRLLAAREAAGGICVCVAVRAGPLYKQVTAVKTVYAYCISNYP